MPLERPFQLEDWYVDPGRNHLTRGQEQVKLEARVMTVLCVLAAHSGQVLTREAIEAEVWGSTVVGYDALTRCIAALRKALGDNVRQPRYIETIAKRGYRLVAQVDDESTDSETNPSKPLAWLTVVLLGSLVVIWMTLRHGAPSAPPRASLPVVVDKLPVVQILPFENLAGDSDGDALSRGIQADVTLALTSLNGLQAIAQSADTATPRSTYRLTGTLQPTSEGLRVNVRLRDDQGLDLWSQQYDRPWQNALSLQNDITLHVAQSLSVELSAAERRRIARRYTTSGIAYGHFLRGQASYLSHTERHNDQARAWYQKAVEQDPAFARAYSAMALTHVAGERQGWTREPNSLERALELAQRGVMLDPDIPQTQWALAYVHLFRRDYAKADVAANRAAALAPNFADSYPILAICRIHRGEPTHAVRLIRRAMQLKPEYPAAYASVLGQAYYFAGHHEAAVPALRDALARNGQLLTAHVFRVATLEKLGRAEEAEWAAAELRQAVPAFTAGQLDDLIAVQTPSIVTDIRKRLVRHGF